MTMWTTEFWKSTGERTIRTIAQTLLALIGTDLVGVTELEWTQMALASITAGIVTVLTCVVATGVGDKGTPAFLPKDEQ